METEQSLAQQLFNDNFDAIAAAKQRTGDWEQAYQLVTGRAWPSGSNVAIKNGQGAIIKDLPWWRDAAKYAGPVAGIAAAPFTGGLSAALIGAGAGAAGSAISGGGVGDALKWAGAGAGAGYGADKLFSMGGGAAGGGGGGFIKDSVKGVADAATGSGVAGAVKRLAEIGLPVGMGLLGRGMRGSGGGIGGNAAMSPELQALLGLAMRRMQDQEPLFQSINAQALGGLPTAYQKG